MKISTSPLLACLLLLVTASALCASHTYTYTMSDLGDTAGDGFAVPRGVNASGQVAVAVGPADCESSDVFVYSNSTFTNLCTLGGNSGIGDGINTSGQVIGYSTN